jgi:valyl-tRNA synthetase
VAAETRSVAGWALDQILVMLHPVMPFLTEELWHQLSARGDLILARWVATDALPEDAQASADIDWLIGLLSDIRSLRAEMSIPWKDELLVCVVDAPIEVHARIQTYYPAIQRIVRGMFSDQTPPSFGTAIIARPDATYAVLLEGIIDLAAEKARLEKALAAAVKERDALAGRLANPGFTEKAKPEAVEKAREDHAARAAEAERLAAALARLG